MPTRGAVPAAAIPGAEECVRLLQLQFSLLAASGRTPTDDSIKATLRGAGLRDPVVSPGPKFAASTGSACIAGSLAGAQPSMVITPLTATGSCTP